jgi:hypothetical protein
MDKAHRGWLEPGNRTLTRGFIYGFPIPRKEVSDRVTSRDTSVKENPYAFPDLFSGLLGSKTESLVEYIRGPARFRLGQIAACSC